MPAQYIHTTKKPGYILCASPRSGSTMLCDLLKQSEIAGSPESFFRPASIDHFAQMYGLDPLREYWDKQYLSTILKHGENETGIFGMRIMWSDMKGFLHNLQKVFPNQQNAKETLTSELGVQYFVHLEREDKIAQAISLVIAKTSGLWHAHADGSAREGNRSLREPVYDFEKIYAEYTMLITESEGWKIWFTQNSIQPLHILYESLAENPLKITGQVLNFLDKTPDQALALEPTTARLSSAVNDTWNRRFRSDLEMCREL